MDHQGPDPEPTPSPALRSEVGISQAIESARFAAASATPDDGPYGELMATYVEHGELLEAWNRGEAGMTDAEFEAECNDYLDRLIRLGRANKEHMDQQWALWMAKNCGEL